MKKEAFGELVISNQESWYRIAKSYLCNDADCADAIQNAIVHAFENLYSLRNDKYAKTWFIRILINECHQVIRENKKVVTWEEYQEEGREAEYIRGYGQYSELYESIMRLKENERTCILLYVRGAGFGKARDGASVRERQSRNVWCGRGSICEEY